MIGALRGKPQFSSSNSLILFTGGVGYKVFVNTKLLENLPENEDLLLYTHAYFREDTQELYGFLTREELFLFELMIDISGVGPKMALAVLERGEKEVREAVFLADVEFFTSIPRIGRKNAQKIIIELKGKLGSLTDLDLTGKVDSQTKEIIEALSGMGFKRSEVQVVLRQLPQGLETTEQKLKEALKRLGK
jgi:Holliday junction DNA helicase RuvA